jgi:hypothetical protein
VRAGRGSLSTGTLGAMLLWLQTVSNISDKKEMGSKVLLIELYHPAQKILIA